MGLVGSGVWGLRGDGGAWKWRVEGWRGGEAERGKGRRGLARGVEVVIDGMYRERGGDAERNMI